MSEIRIREHRGGYGESIVTQAIIENNMTALCAFINERLSDWIDHKSIKAVTPEDLKIAYFGFDNRDNWGETYSVYIEGYGAFGVTNGPIE